MPESGAVLPGALEPERFFGRVEEFRRLRRQARSIVRGSGRSSVLCARPGAGKTELLRQWHGQLFREGEVFPFWYAFPRRTPEHTNQAADFVSALAIQSLAFKRRDPTLFTRQLSIAELSSELRSTWGSAGGLLSEALNRTGCGGPGPASLAWAAIVPHRLAACTGTRILCLYDDVGHLATAGLAWPEESTASSIAPMLATIDVEGLATRLFGRAAASQLTLERLGPLTHEAALRLARNLARTAGLELAEQAVAVLADESAGSPYYLGALVRGLAEGMGTGPLDVVRAAAAAACEGELARYWLELLESAIPERRTRATALEILTYCLREGVESPDPQRLASLMLKPEADVETALAGLSQAGVVRVGCASLAVDEDPVLRDVVQALYRSEFGRMTPATVVATLTSEKVRGAPAARRRRWRETVRGALRTLFGAWAGQQVPASLFDAASQHDRSDDDGGVRRGADTAQASPAETKAITLPHVASVTSGRVGYGMSLPGLEVDALAWAMRAEAGAPDSDIAWVVRILPGGAGASEQLVQFDRDVTALQMAGELPATRVVRWAILEARLDRDGESTAAKLKLSTTMWPQLEALAGLLGLAVVFPQPGSLSPTAPVFDIEMVIPRVADVELVAARALEQLAENLDIDDVVTARLKTALVEACINAFEHSGVAAGRVRLQFTVCGGRLLVRVESRGRTLAALPAPSAAGREARGRGWGLTLIRELVDEVALEPREDGVSLLMVHHLGGK